MNYYNLDVKEGAPELAISGTFKTIKGLADVANVQSAPPLPNKIRRARSFSGPAYFIGNEHVLNLRGEQVHSQPQRCVASRSAARATEPRSRERHTEADVVGRQTSARSATFILPAP